MRGLDRLISKFLMGMVGPPVRDQDCPLSLFGRVTLGYWLALSEPLWAYLIELFRYGNFLSNIECGPI